MTGSATKQSILSLRGGMDCFAEPVIGRRFAPTRWLAMTVSKKANLDVEKLSPSDDLACRVQLRLARTGG
jgi:hypothetical protein